MTWNLKRSLILGAVLLVGIVAWWQVRAAPSASTAPPEIETFQMTADPEEVILSLYMRGSFGPGNHSTKVLTGDGTYRETRGSTGTTKTATKSVQLAYVEMEDLVRIAVDGGLIGLDWEGLEAKILEKHPGVRTVIDSPRIHIEFSLASAQTADGKELGPVSSTFSCACVPSLLAAYHPDVREVRALDALIRAMGTPFDRKKAQP